MHTCTRTKRAHAHITHTHTHRFQDHLEYKGRQVCFYKRAQILAGDIWGAFKGKGLGAMHDVVCIWIVCVCVRERERARERERERERDYAIL